MFAEYGAYETYNTFIKSSFSNEKFTAKMSVNYTQSENDYQVGFRKKHQQKRTISQLTFNLETVIRLTLTIK